MRHKSRIDETDWPRRGGGGRRRATAEQAIQWQRLWRPAGWLIRVFLLIVIALPSLIVTSPTYVSYASTLPDVNEVSKDVRGERRSYAADGTTLRADLHPQGYQHYYEPLSAMGTYLPEATIAIEDRNFYSEPGVDPGGIARATLVDWRSHGTVQGASTITQQLVKVRLVGDEHSIDRKVREALLSFEIEQRFSKDQILEMYLNAVFFGNSSAGSAAAAQIYFHKKTADLTLGEAAMLAGLVRGPTYYSPLNDWTRAKARQKAVLEAMVRSNKITQLDADKAYGAHLNRTARTF